MKRTTLAFLLAALTLLATGNATAQPRQTIQGAQTFLQGLGQNGGSAGIYPRYGVYNQATFDGEPALLNVWLKAFDDIDESGKSNPCVTRLTAVDASDPGAWAQGIRWRSTTESVTLTGSLAAFPLPRYVHWGKAAINRETFALKDGSRPYTYITARYLKPGQTTAEAFFIGAVDPGMADRIEYAMKFLQASCDPSAATGF